MLLMEVIQLWLPIYYIFIYYYSFLQPRYLGSYGEGGKLVLDWHI